MQRTYTREPAPCKHRICHPEGPCNCPPPSRPMPDRWMQRSEWLTAALWPIRTQLAKVPGGDCRPRSDGKDTYYTVAPRFVTVACVCRRASRFYETGFLDCPCGRTFCWTGRSLYAVKL